MGDTPSAAIWPVLIYKDGPAAIKFLSEAFGFEEALIARSDDDPHAIVHAELRWPQGGGVMLGSAGAGEEPFTNRATGTASIYVVTDRPDAVHERAVAAGAAIARPLRDEDYGSRGFTASDPEGNLWSFGTYTGT
jgi:uncharacterized glyoxalase superfamily protein PhnB